VLTARSIRAGHPVFNCPLVCTRPFHDRFDALMRSAKLGSQSIPDDGCIALGTTTMLSTSRKTSAVLR
jgi:hypothetical protein